VSDVQAAGAIAWRPAGDRLEVLLIHRQRYDDWSFPKGKLDPDEHLVAAAIREVHEETGVMVRLGPQVIQHSYPQQRPPGVTKNVTYWAARPTDGNGAGANGYTPTDEVDEVCWLDIDEAAARLTYPRDVAVLERFGRIVAQQGHRSDPLIVLRHGSAAARRGWSGEDRGRPLSPKGVAQAHRLVPLLSAYGVDTVLSSDAQRCVDTLQPYADVAGLSVETDARWSEEDAEQDDVHTALAALSADRQRVVVCTHRPVLPWVFKGLGLPAIKLNPGSAVVVHRREGDIVGTELLAP